MKLFRELHILVAVMVVSMGLIQISKGSVQANEVKATEPIIAPGALKKFILANHPKNLKVEEIRKVQKRLSDVVYLCMKKDSKTDETCKALWAAIYL